MKKRKAKKKNKQQTQTQYSLIKCYLCWDNVCKVDTIRCKIYSLQWSGLEWKLQACTNTEAILLALNAQDWSQQKTEDYKPETQQIRLTHAQEHILKREQEDF